MLAVCVSVDEVGCKGRVGIVECRGRKVSKV